MSYNIPGTSYDVSGNKKKIAYAALLILALILLISFLAPNVFAVSDNAEQVPFLSAELLSCSKKLSSMENSLADLKNSCNNTEGIVNRSWDAVKWLVAGGFLVSIALNGVLTLIIVSKKGA